MMKLQTSPKEFREWNAIEKTFHYWGFGEYEYSNFIGPTAHNGPQTQYTGLKDKEGKKIFEGDICKFHSLDRETVWSPKVIEWRDGRYKLGNTLIIICEMEASQIEVIGNIFENPELTLCGEENETNATNT